jgi:hypothetical protein
MLPICSVRDVPGLYLRAYPLPPGFSRVFIPKGLKVLCFATLLQVLIVKRLKSKNASRDAGVRVLRHAFTQGLQYTRGNRFVKEKVEFVNRS